MLNSQDEEQLEQHLLEGGKQKALKAMEMKTLIEEEDLSDDEVIKQLEHNKHYHQMKERAKREQLKEIEKKNELIDAQLENMCIDLDEEKRIKKMALKRQTTQEEQSTKAQSKSTLKTVKSNMKFSVSSMLNKKKVIPNEVEQPKKSYNPSGGMAQFFKREGNPQPAKANNVMLFKQRKKNV